MAVGLAVSAVLLFRRQRTPIDPRGTVTHVVNIGPYAFTRNPMYVSLMLVYIGATLGFALPWAVVGLVPVFLALHYGVIVPEEQYMLANFGEEYRRYTQNVPRWL